MSCRMRVRNPSRRRGMTVIEIGVAAVMLATILASTVQVLRVLETRQRAADRRALALQAVQNLTEQIGNQPWEKLTPEAVRQFAVPKSVAARLPGANVVVEVVDEAEPVEAKRVSVELIWLAADKQYAKSIRLTSWVFPGQLPSR